MSVWDDTLRFITGREEAFSSDLNKTITDIEEFLKQKIRI
jgi:hypothetical protein